MTDPEERPPEETPVPERLVYTSGPALLTALLLSTVLLVCGLAGWWAVGPDIRAQVTGAQVATLLFFLLLMIGIAMSLGYSRLWADEDGVTVRNGPVLRRYQLDQIAGLRLRSGDAWAYLLIKRDGQAVKRPVLAIQQLEGAGARRKMRDLRAWLKANGATSSGVTLSDD